MSKIPEITSEDRGALRQALLAFGRRYLQALAFQGAPMRGLGFGAWQSLPNAPQLFCSIETRPPPDVKQWAEYQAIETRILGHPKLKRFLIALLNSPGNPFPDSMLC